MALNLKSASGAGYTFEDKVAALLLAEMLLGHQSLGKVFRPLDRIERLALNLNPFDDLLLTTRDKNGAEIQCACSVTGTQTVVEGPVRSVDVSRFAFHSRLKGSVR